jgi:thioredoxin 1
MTQLIKNGREFHEALKVRGRVIVLFYTSWCPHSARFLPIFERHAGKNETGFMRVLVDSEESLSEKYSVAVVPTLIFFEKGQESKRLDGIPGMGINEYELTSLISACSL